MRRVIRRVTQELERELDRLQAEAAAPDGRLSDPGGEAAAIAHLALMLALGLAPEGGPEPVAAEPERETGAWGRLACGRARDREPG